MEILGIGASELIFILLIAIIILGPKDMQKAGKTIGHWLNRFVRSDGWKALQRATREIQNLPTNLMREANLDELKQINQDIHENIDPSRPARPATPSPDRTPSTPPKAEAPLSNQVETSPQPPADNSESTSDSAEQQ